MDRRDKTKPPRPGMRWSRTHHVWVDPDTRTPERRAKDEAILRDVERDQGHVKSVLRTVGARRGKGGAKVEESADRLVETLLRSLIDARERAGLSQAEVARRMGVPQPAVARFEAGTHSPTLTTLARYATAIGVELRVRRTA